MNLLYISYWGINEGLTSSTILPYLNYLSNKDQIENIFFCTVERENISPNKFNLNKVTHYPVYSKNIKPHVLNKIVDSFLIKRKLIEIINLYQIDKVICKASMAGAFGNYIYQKKGIKYIVDSFEPHSDYMLEANTWSRYGLKYLTQKKWEKRQEKNAYRLIVVSNIHKAALIKKGVSRNKIEIIPSCVNVDVFKFNSTIRYEYRDKLNITDSIVGIYVGKFGDIYYDDEAFVIFKELFNQFDKFFLIILSPNSKDEIELKLATNGIDLKNTHIKLAKHNEVANYLSAADFAISTIRPTFSRKFCSPIKHGEYWANGLPLFASVGMGDDSELIIKEGVGISYNYENNLLNSILQFKNDLPNFNRLKQNNASNQLAKKYRSFNIGFKIMDKVLNA